MLQFKLETERLDLFPFESNEVQIFHQLNVDPFIRKYLWDDELISQSLAKDILQQNLKHLQEDRFGLWKMVRKDTQDLIGYTGLWYFFEEPQPQLIYAILEKYSGQGYATEGASIIVDYGKNQLKYTYLKAATDEVHEASQKVLLRLGFHFQELKELDGKLTKFFRINFK